MEDRIFGYFRDVSSGMQVDMNTPLQPNVIYDVTYPITGTNTLIIGSWETTAISSVTHKVSKYGCNLLYMAIDPSKDMLRVQFEYIDTTVQSMVSELISYIVTFGVTPQITLSDPDNVVSIPTSLAGATITPPNIGVAVGVIAILGTIGYLLLNTRK